MKTNDDGRKHDGRLTKDGRDERLVPRPSEAVVPRLSVVKERRNSEHGKAGSG